MLAMSVYEERYDCKYNPESESTGDGCDGDVGRLPVVLIRLWRSRGLGRKVVVHWCRRHSGVCR